MPVAATLLQAWSLSSELLLAVTHLKVLLCIGRPFPQADLAAKRTSYFLYDAASPWLALASLLLAPRRLPSLGNHLLTAATVSAALAAAAGGTTQHHSHTSSSRSGNTSSGSAPWSTQQLVPLPQPLDNTASECVAQCDASQCTATATAAASASCCHAPAAPAQAQPAATAARHSPNATPQAQPPLQLQPGPAPATASAAATPSSAATSMQHQDDQTSSLLLLLPLLSPPPLLLLLLAVHAALHLFYIATWHRRHARHVLSMSASSSMGSRFRRFGALEAAWFVVGTGYDIATHLLLSGLLLQELLSDTAA